ncbi:MAG: efflux transporter outer membrane subunit [Planctomycetota bacterium]
MPVQLQLRDELPRDEFRRAGSSSRNSRPSRSLSLRGADLLLIPMLISVLLTGCGTMKNWARNGFKVGPEYGRPAAPVSEEWIDDYDERISAELPQNPMWWEVFDDPILDQLVQSVYDQNLTLRAAGMRVLNARAQRGIAIGGWFPQQQSQFGQFRRDRRSITTSGLGSLIGRGPVAIERESTTWSSGVNMAWELDIWGKFRRRIEAADASLEASVEEYDAVLVSLVADTASTYVEYRTAQKRLAYAKANVQAQKGSLKIVTARRDAGKVSDLDVAQTTTTLKNTEQLIPQFEAQIRSANNRLCTLLGIPVQDLSEQLGERPIPTAPAEVAVGIPADLLRRRPDVRAAERQVAAQCAQIGVTTADLFPHFSINGALQFESERFKHLVSSAANAGYIAPGFQWDILNYGRLINAVRAEEALFQDLARQYQQSVLTANEEAETAINSFLKSQERLITNREAVVASRKAWTIGKDQETEGLIDYNRVFNLEVLKVQDEDRYATTQGDLAQALITIYRALGGGWEIRGGYTPASPGTETPADGGAAPETPESLEELENDAFEDDIPAPEAIRMEDLEEAGEAEPEDDAASEDTN